MISEYIIQKATCNYEKEPLQNAFRFKGSSLSCLWQTAVRIETGSHIAVGLGVQSVLWSDASVFALFGEEGGNRAMFQVTQYAVSLLEGAAAPYPFTWLTENFAKIYTYAKKITHMESLRKTFVLNALVPVDFALWQLWYKQNKKTSFDEICSFDGVRQNTLMNIPLITYNTTLDEVHTLAKNGASLLKIKLGSNPGNRNNPEDMLDWDKNRFLEIHETVKDIHTPYTKTGSILYYADINGRYTKKEQLLSLLDFAKEHGFLNRIALLEEPFDEQNKIDVHDIPVTVAADESAHCPEDVKERFKLGYRALALKPIAKTLSMTMLMSEYAKKHNMTCFCADLTVNPIMVSWNQCVATRLTPLPDMNIGVVESNGEQNYANWPQMTDYHPTGFVPCKNGVFQLDDAFFHQNGGVFELSEHFDILTQKEEYRHV